MNFARIELKWKVLSSDPKVFEMPNGSANPGWFLLFAGVIIAGIGLFWLFGPSVPWLGQLPGDFRVDRPGARFYFPLATCLLLSLALTLALYLFRLFRN